MSFDAICFCGLSSCERCSCELCSYTSDLAVHNHRDKKERVQLCGECLVAFRRVIAKYGEQEDGEPFGRGDAFFELQHTEKVGLRQDIITAQLRGRNVDGVRFVRACQVCGNKKNGLDCNGVPVDPIVLCDSCSDVAGSLEEKGSIVDGETSAESAIALIAAQLRRCRRQPATPSKKIRQES